MAWEAYDTDTSTGDNPAEFAAINKNREDALDTHHLGAAAPATGLGNGRVWMDSTTSTLYIPKLYQNSAWVQLMGATSTHHRAFLPLDMNDAQIINHILEKLATGSLPTTEGMIWYDDTLNIAGFSDGTNKLYVARCESDATTYARIPCSLNVATLGTAATANTSTICGGWTMDAAAEQLNVVALEPIPNGWTGANDLTLEVDCLLLAAETASDTINIGCTWRSLSDGDGPTKTGTAATDASHDIGSNNAQYDRNLVSVTIDYDHADNPVAVGDMFLATIDHDIAAGANPVAGIIVVACYLKVPVFNFDA